MIHVSVQYKHDKELYPEGLNLAKLQDSAFDLRAAVDVEVHKDIPVLIGSGLSLHIRHPAVFALVLPRSGMGHKGLVLGNLVGLIDNGYQGEIMISLWNRSSHAPILVKRGDRVAQLLFQFKPYLELQPVNKFEFETERAGNGFGSTGAV